MKRVLNSRHFFNVGDKLVAFKSKSKVASFVVEGFRVCGEPLCDECASGGESVVVFDIKAGVRDTYPLCIAWYTLPELYLWRVVE